MREQEAIRDILDANRLAVLATQREGQPHTSLVAITPIEGIRSLVFATHRKTLKYRNISIDGRVSLFFGDHATDFLGAHRTLLTAHGFALEAPEDKRSELATAHADRHPYLLALLGSTDAALVCVNVKAYQLVHSIDDVRWYNPSDHGKM
jgi:nitroimidazol reductase NimA-like FMN-containing flavoprotein (pyridoxamine 5'-phosphate oxidase superfamily)